MNYVIMHNGRPVADCPERGKAEAFVRRNTLSQRHPAQPITWTDTGKFSVAGHWTGWEVVPVDGVK